jgi:hypothetical protein
MRNQPFPDVVLVEAKVPDLLLGRSSLRIDDGSLTVRGLGILNGFLLLFAEFDERRLVSIIEESQDLAGDGKATSNQFPLVREHHREHQVHDRLPLGIGHQFRTREVDVLDKKY